MLPLINLEEIEGLLLRVSSLVSLQEQRSSFFPDAVRAWVFELERCFQANRMPQSSQLANLRSAMLSADRGAVPTNVEFRGKPTRSKILSALGSVALRSATDIALEIVQSNRPRFTEAEALVRQLVSVARNANLLPNDILLSREAYLAELRLELLGRAELAPGVLRIEGLVGPRDALIMFDRVLTADEKSARSGTN